jgi:hypothetical protein
MLKPCPPVSGSRAIGRPRRGSASMEGGSGGESRYLGVNPIPGKSGSVGAERLNDEHSAVYLHIAN